jgi:3-oxoacyl-[acyl-carrier-protein] synthase III
MPAPKYRFGDGLSRAGRRWNDIELATLATLYPDTPTKDIAAKLQRTVKAVRIKVDEMCLHRSERFIAAIRS